MAIFNVEVYFLMQEKDGSCFHIHSLSMYLFIGELRQLILISVVMFLMEVVWYLCVYLCVCVLIYAFLH